MSNLGELKITPYNTVKNSNMRETNIDSFIKTIGSGINKYDVVVSNALNAKIVYDVDVYKEADNLYKIAFINDNKQEDFYTLNTEKYSRLTKQFDEFVKLTDIHRNEEKIYMKIEENGGGTVKENKVYLKYLKKIRKRINISNIKNLSPTLFMMFSLAALSILGQHSYGPGIASVVGVTGVGVLIASARLSLGEHDNGRYFFKDIGLNRSLKKKMNRVLKKLKQSGDVDLKNDEVPIKPIETDLYRDNIINYMNSIMNAANKLNKEDRKQKLFILKEILDEYTSKCQALNKKDSKELKLDGNDRQIMMETIDKLTVLEMEVAELLNQKTKDEALFSDNERLMKEINKNIASIQEQDKVMTSSGKVLRK